MPSSRFDPQALKEIATLYMQAYQHDSDYQDPDNEYGELYGAAQQLKRQARAGHFSEEESARVLRALLERINNSLKFSLQTSDLGYKIGETLRQFYGLSPTHVNPSEPSVGHIAQRGLNGPYLPALKAYELQESYLGKNLNGLFTLFERRKQKTKGHSEFTNSKHRTAIKKEILRQIETYGIEQSLTEQATKVLAHHSDFLHGRKTSSIKESLTSPKVFAALYAPEILTMNQRQLVDKFNAIKDGTQPPYNKDKSHSLKALKYALIDHIEQSGQLDDGVAVHEVNQVIDHRRGFFTPMTNTRDRVNSTPLLAQLLPKSKNPQQPMFDQAKADAQQQEQTPTATISSGQEPG
ncbi:hypothetical protein AVI51_09620 [Piscirickettsia salmonis]|uniref:hypothetical protein n=1 Tax=Piscirickettsia salmonis TaxID=1238 RepID=UPI00094A4FBC|nr:hypothetical protein [Piscirickettsia salmonis]APS51092.1 hypothetical protein AVI50_09715 [Piscirickettsia salmonis]APS54300.1 hypothetical protein AVI51_09620 [Piscirickettsia salmonis]